MHAIPKGQSGQSLQGSPTSPGPPDATRCSPQAESPKQKTTIQNRFPMPSLLARLVERLVEAGAAVLDVSVEITQLLR